MPGNHWQTVGDQQLDKFVAKSGKEMKSIEIPKIWFRLRLKVVTEKKFTAGSLLGDGEYYLRNNTWSYVEPVICSDRSRSPKPEAVKGQQGSRVFRAWLGLSLLVFST